ncbi:MAG: carboxypeptidase-like regulatory domain-containing protein [Anaerolineae bacterium]
MPRTFLAAILTILLLIIGALALVQSEVAAQGPPAGVDITQSLEGPPPGASVLDGYTRTTKHPGATDLGLVQPKAQDGPAAGAITGRLVANGVPVPNASVVLRLWNGSSESTVSNATTDGSGTYTFTNPGALASGSTYYVKYGPNQDNPAYVFIWFGPDITSYSSGQTLNGGDLNIAAVPLLLPPDYATETVPTKFTWTMRSTATDWYRLGLFAADTGSGWLVPTVYHNDSYTLQSVAPLTGFQFGKLYIWTLRIYDGTDTSSFGETFDEHHITFTQAPVSTSTLTAIPATTTRTPTAIPATATLTPTPSATSTTTATTPPGDTATPTATPTGGGTPGVTATRTATPSLTPTPKPRPCSQPYCLIFPIVMKRGFESQAPGVLSLAYSLPVRDTIRLMWSASDHAKAYRLWLMNAADGPQVIYAGPDLEYTLSGQPVGTYVFSVDALGVWGVTASNSVTIVVKPPPTPTATPTMTATPRPTNTPTPPPDPNTLYLCSSRYPDYFLTQGGCYGMRGISRLISPIDFDATLLRDIRSGDYKFDLFLDGYGPQTVEAQIIHKHGGTEDVLAQMTVDVSGPQTGNPSESCLDFNRTPTHVIRTVRGPDPAVIPNTSQLIVRIRSLSGWDACIRYGDDPLFKSVVVIPFVALAERDDAPLVAAPPQTDAAANEGLTR